MERKSFFIIYVYIKAYLLAIPLQHINQIIDGNRKSYIFYCTELSIVVTNRLENDAMAFGQIRQERERERERERQRHLMVLSQRLCGHRQSAHLGITDLEGTWRKFTQICSDVDICTPIGGNMDCSLPAKVSQVIHRDWDMFPLIFRLPSTDSVSIELHDPS
jgi:hypothetical protein